MTTTGTIHELLVDEMPLAALRPRKYIAPAAKILQAAKRQVECPLRLTLDYFNKNLNNQNWRSSKTAFVKGI